MCTILLVEDNLMIRELVREILEIAGYEVVEACDGNEALRMTAETLPSLVLLDIQLPGLDGFTVLHHLRRDTRFNKIPVIALTAYALHSDRQRILEAGFDCYMTKPINRASLLENIHSLLVSIRLAEAKKADHSLPTPEPASTNHAS
ncbi:MAG TPA: response regulator [Terriglobales bacterium]|jgi:CheY-like chemotaxis protein|nr:response regulator [Terriglobales bacterium]